jgi:hypothetical protein
MNLSIWSFETENIISGEGAENYKFEKQKGFCFHPPPAPPRDNLFFHSLHSSAGQRRHANFSFGFSHFLLRSLRSFAATNSGEAAGCL